MPDLKDSVLFLEDDETSKPYDFDRNLQSLIHLPEFGGVGGIVVGRFQKASGMTDAKLKKIIQTKTELKNILKSLGYEVTETKNGEGRTALETEPQSAYFSKFKNDIPYKIRIENGKEKSIKVKLFEQQKNKNIKIPKSKSSVDELYYKELRDRLEKSFKNK